MALHVIDGMGTIYDALRGASNYTELQLSAFDDWLDANLDYSRALPSTEMLNMEEKAEYASIYSDVETFLKRPLQSISSATTALIPTTLTSWASWRA